MKDNVTTMSVRIIIDDDAVEARQREKADARMRDLERLRRGEVTAEELQEENSLFPPGWARNVVIEDYYEKVGRGA